MAQRSGSNRLFKGCLTALGLVLLLCVLLASGWALTSCSINKSIVGAGLPNPDTAYQTGTVTGYNVYIWECYQGKRIVMYNATSEMWLGAFQREETACGVTAPIETKLANEQKRDLDPQRFW